MSIQSPQEFVAKWKKVTLKESAASHEHFLDLCELLHHDKPATADPEGKAFVFEKSASLEDGKVGRADVWKKGYFIWEYKGKHKDLAEAYRQLQKYRDGLDNPPLLVVSDMDTIIVHTNFTGQRKQTVTISLDDLVKPQAMKQLNDVFSNPHAFEMHETTEQVTTKAATDFARLAELLSKYGEDPQAAAHFLIRLLFCLFAEDVGLLPKGILKDLIRNTRGKKLAFMEQLRQLFKAMSVGGYFGKDPIPHFDGRLFDDATVLPLDSDSMDILEKASELDWSSIEPSILGTLFERSLDPLKRSQAGLHYTSRQDIVEIIKPVLMAPLYQEWEAVEKQARGIVEQRDQSQNEETRKQHSMKLFALLTGFKAEIAHIRILDPACGSGNFLYVGLKELLDLEKQVIAACDKFGMGLILPIVTPAQLHGIEKDDYAYELAQATVWIGYIQWLNDNGFGLPSEPILKPIETVLHEDAIVLDQDAKVSEPTWPEVDVIIGNPPFLGGKLLRSKLGDPYVDNLFALYNGRVPHEADYVCYWFEKARAMVEEGKARRVGLLATQGIRGGANRKVLEHIKETGDIFWAQSDREWVQEGAAVRVSMVGFDNGTEPSRILDGKSVASIHPDLTGALDLTKAKLLPENAGIAFMGDTKGGSFEIPEALAFKMLGMPNPHGKSNKEVVRKWVNGLDIVRRPRAMWIIDFGTAMSLEEASMYEAPFEYVKKHVKPQRDKSRSTISEWWLHERPRVDMRDALAGLERYIVTTVIAKHRLFVWLSADTLADHALIAIARDDDYTLGILHSRLHELWALRLGTQLESRPRYTPTTTFETFPFPWPTGKEPKDNPHVKDIAAAARDLVEKRDGWLNPKGVSDTELKKLTLTNLYNQRPTWLQIAHQKLDEAVFDAYGWPYSLTDEEILERLLALNLERATVP